MKDLPRLRLLAESHKLTAYDAAYLDLAMRLSLPIATGDGDLRKAAAAESVELLPNRRNSPRPAFGENLVSTCTDLSLVNSGLRTQ